MLKEMNKEIFSRFLNEALDEIKQKEGIESTNDNLIIDPVIEKSKI